MTAKLAAPSRVDQVWSPVPRLSNRASLMVSLVIKGRPRWRARGTARVVLPLPGAPVTSRSVSKALLSVSASLESHRRSARPDHGGAGTGARGGTNGRGPALPERVGELVAELVVFLSQSADLGGGGLEPAVEGGVGGALPCRDRGRWCSAVCRP